MSEHLASLGTAPFGVVQHLKNTLEAKRAVLVGQVSEYARIERAMAASRAQIAEIEAAISKLESQP